MSAKRALSFLMEAQNPYRKEPIQSLIKKAAQELIEIIPKQTGIEKDSNG